MTNYGEATIREICWNKWRGYIDGVGVIEFVNTSEETAKHAANRWWAALHAQPWESQSALRNVSLQPSSESPALAFSENEFDTITVCIA